jgi:hypothetical protein
MSIRSILWIIIAALIAIGGGWLWGATGKATVMADRRLLADRADFFEARALILAGRVHLFELNFGDGAARFADAQRVLAPVQTRLRETSQAERAGRVEIVLAQLREAERLARALDPAAHGAAAQAVLALDAVQ